MCTLDADVPISLQSATARERIEVLAVCLESDQSLGRSLEAILSTALEVHLVRMDLAAGELQDSAVALALSLAAVQPSVVLLCLSAGAVGRAGMVFEVVRKQPRELPVVLILERADTAELRALLDLGAADFSLTPLRAEDLLSRLARWHNPARKRNPLIAQLNERLGLRRFIGESPVFLNAVHMIPKLARCDVNVFITGETGTGKEMFARAIHYLGPRAEHPFLEVNCGAIPAELMENELFGHEAGAFTGATSSAPGLIHEADRGTLFLDEIDALPLPMQVKLLRFLQDREYRPLGSRKTCTADVRVISASNADLDHNIRSGQFRADLFYRLNVLPLRLPPLRERRGDIPMLARYFVEKYAREFALPPKELSAAAVPKLVHYGWPGNVRELENVIERALVLCDEPRIRAEDICLQDAPSSVSGVPFRILKARAIADFETAYIRQLLAANEGNISRAARAAQKPRRAFWQLMRKHRINSPGVASPK